MFDYYLIINSENKIQTRVRCPFRAFEWACKIDGWVERIGWEVER